MRLCTSCLHLDERKIEHCPACGGTGFAKVNRQGAIVAIPPSEAACSGCMRTHLTLRFRVYRWVVAYIFGATIHRGGGYLCRACRWRHFAAAQAKTLLLGWWGVVSAYFHNP